MSIVRVVEWKLRCSPEEADMRVRQAMSELGLDPEGPLGAVRGKAKRSMMKNRWSAQVSIDLAPAPGGTTAVCRVEMPAGTKHYEVLSDIAEAMGEDDLLDDRGVAAAVQRLGTASRLFGRREVRHLRNLLDADETVMELGQGMWSGKNGLVVLSNKRLFFFEKSLGSETVEQFDLSAINSLTANKRRTGETLVIHASGNQAEIQNMAHGQGDALARAFRQTSHAQPTATSQSTVLADDPLAQLERLAMLRDHGVLTAEEFEAKKADLLRRL